MARLMPGRRLSTCAMQALVLPALRFKQVEALVVDPVTSDHRAVVGWVRLVQP